MSDRKRGLVLANSSCDNCDRVIVREGIRNTSSVVVSIWSPDKSVSFEICSNKCGAEFFNKKNNGLFDVVETEDVSQT